MLALRTLSITKADYISRHLIKIPQRANPKRDYLGFRFSSVTWTHALRLQHVAGGGCPLDGWPEALRGLRMLGLLSLFPVSVQLLLSCSNSTLKHTVKFPRQSICQAPIAPRTCFGAQTPFCNLPSLASWLDLEPPRFVTPTSVCVWESLSGVLAKVGKTLLEYGTIPWTSELHTWRSQRALGWRKPSYVPQPDAGGMSGGGPAPIFPQNLVSSHPVTPVMALEFNSEPRTRS